MIVVDNIMSSATMISIAENTDSEYTMIYTKSTPLTIGLYALRRMIRWLPRPMRQWYTATTILWRTATPWHTP